MSEIMSNNVAYVIKTISEIRKEDPGKKVLQKMVFLIEQKGVNLGYEYGLHFYGPYSADLDHDAACLASEGIIEIDYSSGYSHKMSVLPEYAVESDLPNENREMLKDVVRHFCDRSPCQLELLTTALYAYYHLKDKSRESVINGVKKIKGAKYTEQQIEAMIEEEFGYFDIAI